MKLLKDTTRQNAKVIMFSKTDASMHTFRLAFKSEFDSKRDVFVNQSTGNVVFRDSIRRKFF